MAEIACVMVVDETYELSAIAELITSFTYEDLKERVLTSNPEYKLMSQRQFDNAVAGLVKALIKLDMIDAEYLRPIERSHD